MKKYVGNCSDAFDWDQIISKFDERQVSHKKYEEGSTASKEIDDAWAESKESVDFFTYHTGEAYDPDLDKRFGEWITLHGLVQQDGYRQKLWATRRQRNC